MGSSASKNPEPPDLKKSKDSKETYEINLRLVRTYFDTPRKRAVLEITTEKNEVIIKGGSNNIYYVTIKDRGLRTIEHTVCDYATINKKIEEWISQYKCTIYNSNDETALPMKLRSNSAAF